MLAWEDSDKVDWFRIQNDLKNPESGLSLVLQDLVFLREKYIEKIKRSRKEDPIFKSVGVIEGLDIAIKRANEIVEIGKREFESKQEDKELVRI